MKPSVGRIVHYVSYGTSGGEYGSECRAAVITEVGRSVGGASLADAGGEGRVSLAVLNPTGMFFNQGCPYDEWDGTEALKGAQPQGGSWHWPEREGA